LKIEDVHLFVPCYVDQLAPSVAMASLAVLEHAGCRVHYDPRQTCCGQLFLNVGAIREATRLAREWLVRFEKANAVVCPSASCVSTVRQRYPTILSDLTAGERQLCERTFELGEFLVRTLDRAELGARFPHRVALIQSCHGLRELGLGHPSERVTTSVSEPGVTERLLRAVDGLELAWPERPDECCGFGGAFSVTLPELSVRIGRDRMRALAATGAEYVTGTDISCLLHLDGIRRREGYGPRPIHLAEILASGLGK
jgi:L-lactate dehydrogenase complex protein LldE